MKRLPALLAAALWAGCAGPARTLPDDDVGPAVMDRLRLDMSLAEARRTLERARLDLDEEGPYSDLKGTVEGTTLRVKGVRWEGQAWFEDGAMKRVRACWPRMDRPGVAAQTAARIVDDLTRRFGPGSRRASFNLVWRGVKSRLHVTIDAQPTGTRVDESWSTPAESESGARSEDPRFRYHDGWNGFLWGTRYAAMAATVTGTTPMRLDAWPDPSCLREPSSCKRGASTVALRDGDRSGVASFHGDRLEGVWLKGSEPPDREPSAIAAGYAARFGPPSTDDRAVEHAFRDETTSVQVREEASQPDGKWTVCLRREAVR